MADYQITDVPYEGMRQADVREPVLRGVGHGPMGPAADAYRGVAEQLRTVGDRVADALKTAAAAHSGEAAEAAARHIAAMIEPGDTGWAQAELAARALEDTADHHIRARHDMQALPEHDFFTPGSERDRLRTSTVLAGRRYQDNVNHALTTSFQAFPPPKPGDVGIAPAAVTSPRAAGGGARGGGVPAGGGPAGGVAGAGLLADGGGPAGSPAGGVAPAGGSPAAAGVSVVARPGAGAGMPHPAGGNAATTPQSLPGRSSSARPSSPRPAQNGGVGEPAWPPLAGPVLSGGDPAPFWGTGQHVGSGPGRPGVPGPLGGSGGAGGAGRSGPFAEPGARPVPGSPEPAGRTAAAGRGGVGVPGYGAMPMTGAAGGRQDREHHRPPWLVEPDPESVWLGNLPPHTDPVIGAEESHDR